MTSFVGIQTLVPHWGGGVPAPVAAFTADVVTGDAPVTVTFTDASTNTPTSWDWDFGDGSAHSTDQNPSYQYAAAGTYTVVLIATNAGGSGTETKTDYITIYETVTIQTGSDTMTDSALGATNYDTSVTIQTGGNAASRYFRALIRPDLSSIPANAIVASASLQLYLLTDAAGVPGTHTVNRQKRAWVSAQATHNIYSTGNNWQTAGGFGVNDCEQIEIGSLDFTATPTINQFYTWTLTAAAVQEWISGAFAKNGVLVKATIETDTLLAFAAYDNLTAANRPKVVIRYTRPG